MEPNCHCQRCGYKWFSRGAEKPKACPMCKSYQWSKLKEEDDADV